MDTHFKRTLESTISDIVVAVLIVVMWAMAALFSDGESLVWIVPALGTVLSAASEYLSYRPAESGDSGSKAREMRVMAVWWGLLAVSVLLAWRNSSLVFLPIALCVLEVAGTIAYIWHTRADKDSFIQKMSGIVAGSLHLGFFLNIGKMRHREVGRSVEGTVFEAAAAVIVVLAWALATVIYRHSGGLVPTHFDFAGNPDGYGSSGSLFVVAAIGTFVVALTCVCAYHPSTIKMPGRIDVRDYPLAARMTRVLAVELALAMLCIFLATAQEFLDVAFIKFLPAVMAAVIVFSVILFVGLMAVRK